MYVIQRQDRGLAEDKAAKACAWTECLIDSTHTSIPRFQQWSLQATFVVYIANMQGPARGDPGYRFQKGARKTSCAYLPW